MQTMRWTNPTLPQTLQIAVFLFYIDAVFALLGIGGLGYAAYIVVDLLPALGYFTRVLLIVGCAGAGLGIANGRKLGYNVGLGLVIANLAGLLKFAVDFRRMPDLLDLIIAIAMVAVLLHQQSREHVRLWFE